MKTNHFGQLVGDSLAIVSPGRFPDIEVQSGQTVRIEKVNVSHFDDLFAVYSSLTSPEKFTYMPFSFAIQSIRG